MELKKLVKKLMNLQKFNNILSDMEGFDGNKIVVLATTANKNNKNVHIGPLKSYSSDVAINLVFSNLKNLSEIINIFDGNIDLFAIDTEVKNNINNFKMEATKYIKKSSLFYFKPNDYTLTAAEIFISHLTNHKLLSRTLICGLGNIGTKLALKLVEMGIIVEIIEKKNNEKAKKIAEVINLISSSQIKIDVSDSNKSKKVLDIILFCNSAKYEIKKNIISRITSETIIIDIGMGVIGPKSKEIFINLGCSIYSLNTEPGFWGVYTTYNQFSKIFKGFGRKIINEKLVIVSIGVYGNKGDILVDNINEVTKVFGICNGEGSLMENETKLPSARKINLINNEDK